MKFEEYCAKLQREIDLFKSEFLKEYPDMAEKDIWEGDWHEQLTAYLETKLRY